MVSVPEPRGLLLRRQIDSRCRARRSRFSLGAAPGADNLPGHPDSIGVTMVDVDPPRAGPLGRVRTYERSSGALSIECGKECGLKGTGYVHGGATLRHGAERPAQVLLARSSGTAIKWFRYHDFGLADRQEMLGR